MPGGSRVDSRSGGSLSRQRRAFLEKLGPAAGVEPATPSLQNSCSTSELRRQNNSTRCFMGYSTQGAQRALQKPVRRSPPAPCRCRESFLLGFTPFTAGRGGIVFLRARRRGATGALVTQKGTRKTCGYRSLSALTARGRLLSARKWPAPGGRPSASHQATRGGGQADRVSTLLIHTDRDYTLLGSPVYQSGVLLSVCRLGSRAHELA